MSLSLDKFQKLLTTYNMLPLRFYSYHDRIMLAEVMSLANADLFMIYISKDYNFRQEPGYECYSLKRIHLDEKGDIPSKYASRLDDLAMDEYYSKVNLLNTDKMMDRSINIEKELIDDYRKKILVPSSEESMSVKMRDMLNQLQRLDRCVDSKDYSLSIMTSCLIALDPEHIFMVKGRDIKEDRMYIIVLSIETLFKNVNYISKDIPELNNGIQKILSRNHQSHMEKMDDTIDGMIQIQDRMHTSVDKVTRYNGYISKLTGMLEKLKLKEANVKQKKRALQEKTSGGGFDKELSVIKERDSIERDEKWCQQTKAQLYDAIIDLHKKTRNMSLMIDKLLFENLVMMISIQRNMSIL